MTRHLRVLRKPNFDLMLVSRLCPDLPNQSPSPFTPPHFLNSPHLV